MRLNSWRFGHYKQNYSSIKCTYRGNIETYLVKHQEFNRYCIDQYVLSLPQRFTTHPTLNYASNSNVGHSLPSPSDSIYSFLFFYIHKRGGEIYGLSDRLRICRTNYMYISGRPSSSSETIQNDELECKRANTHTRRETQAKLCSIIHTRSNRRGRLTP